MITQGFKFNFITLCYPLDPPFLNIKLSFYLLKFKGYSTSGKPIPPPPELYYFAFIGNPFFILLKPFVSGISNS